MYSSVSSFIATRLCMAKSNSPDNFLVVPNVPWNTLYFHRKLVLEAVLSMESLVKGDLLDLGCGTQPYRSIFTQIKSYVGVDISSSCHQLQPDTVIYDGESIPFPTNSFDWVMATEVFEHVRRPELLLSSIYEVLRPGGGFFLSVPFLAGVHEPPYDFRRWTNYGLVDELERAGFEKIEVRSLGNWHTAAASFIGLYLAHCKKPWWTRYWLTPLVWVIKNLVVKLDSVIETADNMCIGWFAVAYKPLNIQGYK